MSRLPGKAVVAVLLVGVVACGRVDSPGGAAPTPGSTGPIVVASAPVPTAIPSLVVRASPAPTPRLGLTALPGSPAPSTPSPVPAFSPPLQVPTPTQAVIAPDVIVVFRKHGGIAGIDEKLTVHANGLLELVQRRAPLEQQAHTAPADLEVLRGFLSSSDFAQLKPLYQAAGADLFVYEVTVPTVAGVRTIVTMDAAPTPSSLNQIIAELERLRALVG